MHAIRKTSGFTLLELLVVVAIAGLMLAVIPPMLPNVIANAQLKAAARELAAGLKGAREHAVISGEESVMRLDLDERIYFIKDAGRKLALPGETDLTLITADSEQSAEKIGAIRFFPDGSSTGGQIKLHHRQLDYLVDVNWLTGRVRTYP